MQEKHGAPEDCDLHKVTQLNTAELWTHFWVPSFFASAFCCFIFLLCIYSYQHLVQRTVLQWLITAGELGKDNHGGGACLCHFMLDMACEWHRWNTKVTVASLVGRQQLRPREPVWSVPYYHPDGKVILKPLKKKATVIPYFTFFQISHSIQL